MFRPVTQYSSVSLLFPINWNALFLYQETTTKILTDFNPMRYVTVSKVWHKYKYNLYLIYDSVLSVSFLLE